MKPCELRLIEGWDLLLDNLEHETCFLSGGYRHHPAHQTALAYFGRYPQSSGSLLVKLVARIDDGRSHCAIDLLYDALKLTDNRYGKPDPLPPQWQGRMPAVYHHIVCWAHDVGLYELRGEIEVGDLLLWRAPKFGLRSIVKVVGKIEPDGIQLADPDPQCQYWPPSLNSESQVRSLCVRLPAEGEFCEIGGAKCFHMPHLYAKAERERREHLDELAARVGGSEQAAGNDLGEER